MRTILRAEKRAGGPHVLGFVGSPGNGRAAENVFRSKRNNQGNDAENAMKNRE